MKKIKYVILMVSFIMIFMCSISVGHAGKYDAIIVGYPVDVRNEFEKKCGDLEESKKETCKEYLYGIYQNYKNNFVSIMQKCDYKYSQELKSCVNAEIAKIKSNAIERSKCIGQQDDKTCIKSGCAWNSDYGFCSPNGLTYLKCGDSYDIPEIVPKLTSYAVTLLKTVAPIILIVVSIIQLVKAITSGKDDELKKVGGSLLKKVITAALIFLSVTIVQFIMFKVSSDNDEKENLSSCLSCFLNGTSKCDNLYYKDGYGQCYYFDGSKFECGDRVK